MNDLEIKEKEINIKKYELKAKVQTITKKDGSTTEIVQFYIELDLYGKVVPYVLDIDYKQRDLLQALLLG